MGSNASQSNNGQLAGPPSGSTGAGGRQNYGGYPGANAGGANTSSQGPRW